ncbi:hypothetical protein SITYG_15280 [Streptococcus intermedius]|uniref:Uncharacterized protein n=1 Tax=Streptococcus intermedius TaxID=1338 RepID=A0AAD1FK33_STRIT|nr:hypothetical protein SITYG_15280 [Streptococcus intermedius]
MYLLASIIPDNQKRIFKIFLLKKSKCLLFSFFWYNIYNKLKGE